MRGHSKRRGVLYKRSMLFVSELHLILWFSAMRLLVTVKIALFLLKYPLEPTRLANDEITL